MPPGVETESRDRACEIGILHEPVSGPPRDPNAGFAVLPGAQWRDYDGEEVYGDYAVDPDTGAVTPGQAYLLGVGFWNASAN